MEDAVNLNQLMQHLALLYGRRNRVFLSSLHARISFLVLGIGDLQQVIRKSDGDKSRIAKELAGILARLFVIADHFHGLPLKEAMARKYPYTGCSYCGHSPCDCSEQRRDPELPLQAATQQLVWGLREWAQHLDRLYGTANRRRGLDNVLMRLFREASEIMSLELRISSMTGTVEEVEREFAFELADALAWTIAAANILNIDLQGAVLACYGEHCPACRRIPCGCRQFDFRAKSG